MSTATSSLPQPDEILDPIAECLTPEVAREILAVQIDPQVQGRVDELAAKASEGTLTDEERDQYEDLIERADLLGIVKSLARQAVAQ
jgi:hypothetical protein